MISLSFPLSLISLSFVISDFDLNFKEFADYSVPPSQPVITTNASTLSNLREYDVITLTCSSLGGNPAPSLTWYRGGVALGGATYAGPGVKYGNTTSGLVWTLGAGDDGAGFVCVAQNAATAGTAGVSSNTLRLAVQCECLIVVFFI